MVKAEPVERPSDTSQLSQRLLAIIDELAAELQPQTRRAQATLDSRLVADLGLDSLALTELLLRAERELGVSISDEALRAESPRELLSYLLTHRRSGEAHVEQLDVIATEGAFGEPAQAETLCEVLDAHAQRSADRVHVRLYTADDDIESITYGALLASARRIAAGLAERGIEAGQTVALMLPTSRDYLVGFFGVLWAGAIPVPIYPPLRRSQIADHLQRQRGILSNAGVSLLITVPAARAVGPLLAIPVATATQLADAAMGLPLPSAAPRSADDIAFLQYTSGSTGDPKGVVLTHSNLLSNLRTLGRRARVEPSDVFVSWLPLYHDMGLIGAWLGSLYYGLPLALMSPLSFLARPVRWLRAIQRHRGTLTASPNFGYELCLRKVPDEDLSGLDLSSMRLMLNGAEPVSSETLAQFADRYARYGLRREALTPVYGLAESSVGLTMPPPGRGVRIDRVSREEFERTGRARPATEADAGVLTWVGAGMPAAGEQLRIVDESDLEVGERQEGRIEFQGPSATSGYFRNPAATATLFRNPPWRDTGDRGYMADGELFVTGRQKDLIIRAGRNLYPEELEQAVGELPGIRKGCVAVFSSQPDASRPERLVIIAETRETEPAVHAELRTRIADAALERLTVGADDIVIAAPHTVLKTSSGKIRRSATRRLYERGDLGTGRWHNYRDLLATGIASQVRRLSRTAKTVLYSGWAWTTFYLLLAVAFVTVALLPRLSWRWRFVRAEGRLLRRLTATPLRVEGLEHIPDGPCVLAANHSSYLDAIALATALPKPFSYVVKRELSAALRPAVGRLGVIFVERFDMERGSAEAERLIEAARRGQSLAFFPEGTFYRNPGLLPFHMGAFVTAATAGLPVVPVTLRGTRAKLRSGHWWIRPGPVSVIISPAVEPRGQGWQAALELRDAVRAEILRRCGEPDLAAE